MPATEVMALLAVCFLCLARSSGAQDQGGGTPNGSQVCFEGFKCFSMEHPWFSILRPFPEPMSPADMDVKFRFFTRESRKAQVVRVFPQLRPALNRIRYKPSRPVTAVIIHGFASGGKSSWMKIFKDLLLMKVDANVILVDWEKGASFTSYFQVASNARVTGALLARLFQELKNAGQDFKRVHVIGHSLGAHVSSYASKEVGNGIKPSRITGLDPAQPGFEGQPSTIRLSPDDADFVDVIHTDARPFIPFFGLGIMQPVGHVDFYLNGGTNQPNCITESIPKIESMQDIVKMPVEVIKKIVSCSHMRAYIVFMWSLVNGQNCTIWGRKMLNGENFLKITSLGLLSLADPVIESLTNCTAETCTIIGLDTPLMPARGSFAVTTDNAPPYCQRLTDDEAGRVRMVLANGLTNLYNSTVNAVADLQTTISNGLRRILPQFALPVSLSSSESSYRT